MSTTLLDLIFPSACMVCGKRLAQGLLLCETCADEIPVARALVCGACMSRLPYGKKVCHPSFPYLLAAATDYANDTVRALIRHMKFKGVRGALPPLQTFLIKHLESLGLDLARMSVVPVPLHRRRERARGFNQAKLLAEGVSSRFRLPLLDNILIRTTHTKPQSELTHAAARKKNVLGCFTIVEPELVRAHPHILLLDDVSTSGATLKEAAMCLKAAGAKRIIGLVVAKA